MNPNVGADLCRVTVIAPRTRVDVALPADVPLADLLPTLLRYAGEDLPDAGLVHGGWVLQRMGETPLDSSRSVSSLGVRDGEILHFRPRLAQLPELAFDDVVDAIATASQDRSDRWQPLSTRRFGFAATISALAMGVVVLLFAGPDWPAPAAVACVVAVSLVLAGATLSRAVGDGRAGAVLGYISLSYAAVGGLLVLADDKQLLQLGASQVLVANVCVLVVAVLAAISIADGAPNFFGAAAAALIGTVAAAVDIAFDTLTPAGVASLAVSVALGMTPLIPMFSFRLARLPLPAVPTSSDDLRRDNEVVPGPKVLRQTASADRYMTGLVGTVGGVATASLLYLATDSGWASRTLTAVISVTLLLRARLFFGRAQRLWLLIPGLVGVGLLALNFALDSDMEVVELLIGVVLPLMLIALFAMMAAMRVPGARLSPWWGRSADIFEMLLVLSVVPLALAVLDVYSRVRGIGG